MAVSAVAATNVVRGTADATAGHFGTAAKSSDSPYTKRSNTLAVVAPNTAPELTALATAPSAEAAAPHGSVDPNTRPPDSPAASKLPHNPAGGGSAAAGGSAATCG